MWKLPTKYILLAILACLLWSTAFVSVKIGLQYAKPFGFAGIRFMISGLILLPFTGGILRYFGIIRANFQRILILALIQTFIAYAFFYFGMTLVPGALAAIVIGASPLIFAVVAHVMMHDDKITLPKMVSMLIGFTGVAIIGVSRRPWQSAGLTEFIGIFILLAGSTSGAIGNVLVSKDGIRIPPLVLNSAQLFLGGLMLFIISLILEGSPVKAYPLEYYIALIYLSILSAVAFSIWFYLLKKPGVKVSSLNLWKFIIPVLGAVIAWIVLPDEKPEISAIIGMVFVALSILSFNLCNMVSKNCD
ncbi:DMT family transporter [bacterium]|nr:DMT family transporter [bacterium]